ncbi:type II toxin-antitoxin system VapC family toxin [Bacteroides sp. GD17]|jgi:tRNA(fMet)-specific endonuclease VapC|uniref:type II toxin-antitoxin system VapC family toxin n=1 Tax=Bacteroides sp. GD17 TaxID=3139826 RepID=UPI0025CEC877|nr:type II toxin-antitoxin system VapC family toxin [uncultured Bacteroides sp.]
MTKYLLDTNICIFFLQGKYDVPARIEEIGRNNCCISEITVGELLYGAACSSKKELHLAQVKELISLFVVLPIYPVLSFFADFKAELRKQGKLIDDFDLLIGSTAVANKMVLVSENTKHLSRIPGIETENWIRR